MKFSIKLLLWTVIVLAVALGFSGYYFVNFVFETSLNRERGQALDENSILSFAFETAALNAPAQYDVLASSTIEQIAANLSTGGHNSNRLLRISDEGQNVLYISDGFESDSNLLYLTDENTRTYQVIRRDDRYYIQTGTTVNALDRILYLETMRDVSEVFRERALGFLVYRRVMMLMLVFGAVIMNFIASWLTKPIRMLTRATKRMAAGDYYYRARQVSNDELGQLTADFNRMANALEDNIIKLEEELQAREEFVGAFAHELKTPLTSIIGYADMLRSRKLDEEKSFMSANYIYTEGKRLEAMSFRLLEIIVTKRSGMDVQMVSVELFFNYLQDMFGADQVMTYAFRYEPAMVRVESNLLKTVLINLVDNAAKASEAGGKITVEGYWTDRGYCLAVKDQGLGIPQEELTKITQAFYMVDKSRARSKNGAGLGLALCAEILHQHDSRLEIASTLGAGTTVSFVLPAEEQEVLG